MVTGVGQLHVSLCPWSSCASLGPSGLGVAVVPTQRAPEGPLFLAEPQSHLHLDQLSTATPLRGYQLPSRLEGGKESGERLMDMGTGRV